MLKRIKPSLKQGNEKFSFNGKQIKTTLSDFWQWYVSDLVTNATRGVLAEFIVAKALHINTKIVREEWAEYDLKTSNHIKIEVKSAAYLQSWAQKKYSIISFSIKKSHNNRLKKLKRQADVYVFALLHHKDKQTINPLKLEQWKFYVLATKEIDDYKRSEQSITLKSLEKLAQGSVDFFQLKKKVYSKYRRYYS